MSILFSFVSNLLSYTVADPGEGPQGGLAPLPLLLDQNEARRAEKILFWDRAPLLSQGQDDSSPSLSESLDPPLIHYHAPKQKKIKSKPRIKFNHNIYNEKRQNQVSLESP